MKLNFSPTTIFRETPKVTFFDAGIESTNGCDVVIHSGEASPECITTSQPLVDSMPASKKVTLGVSLKIVVGEKFNFIIQPLC